MAPAARLRQTSTRPTSSGVLTVRAGTARRKDSFSRLRAATRFSYRTRASTAFLMQEFRVTSPRVRVPPVTRAASPTSLSASCLLVELFACIQCPRQQFAVAIGPNDPQLAPTAPECSFHRAHEGVRRPPSPGRCAAPQLNVDDVDAVRAGPAEPRRRCVCDSGLPVGTVLLLLRSRRQRLVGPRAAARLTHAKSLVAPAITVTSIPTSAPWYRKPVRLRRRLVPRGTVGY